MFGRVLNTPLHIMQLNTEQKNPYPELLSRMRGIFGKKIMFQIDTQQLAKTNSMMSDVHSSLTIITLKLCPLYC